MLTAAFRASSGALWEGTEGPRERQGQNASYGGSQVCWLRPLLTGLCSRVRAWLVQQNKRSSGDQGHRQQMEDTDISGPRGTASGHTCWAARGELEVEEGDRSG